MIPGTHLTAGNRPARERSAGSNKALQLTAIASFSSSLLLSKSEVRETLLKMCSGKSVDDYVFGNPDTAKPFTDIKRSFHTACRMARIEGLWRNDLWATFCRRLALAGYEALTIMTLMDHKDLKTTMRYIRAVQLQRDVRSQNFGHKSPTQEIRPPVLAAVSCSY